MMVKIIVLITLIYVATVIGIWIKHKSKIEDNRLEHLLRFRHFRNFLDLGHTEYCAYNMVNYDDLCSCGLRLKGGDNDERI